MDGVKKRNVNITNFKINRMWFKLINEQIDMIK